MRQVWTFSAEYRLLLAAVVFLSLSFLVAAALFFNQLETHFDNQYDRLGQMLASVVSVEGEQRLAIPNQADERLRRLTEAILSSSTDVVAIEYYNRQGQLVFENHRAVPSDDLRQVMDYSAPVRAQNGELLGEVHMKLTGESLQTLSNVVQRILWVLLLGTWLLAVLAVGILSYIWSKHLKVLVKGVNRLSSGDFGYRIAERDLWGQLRVLAQAFNDMSLRLRAYEDQNLDTLTFERNKLEAILLSIADGVIVCDEQGEVVLANEPASHMLSLKTVHHLTGLTIQDYTSVEGERCFIPVLKAFGDYRRKTHDGPSAEPFTHNLELPTSTLKVMISPIQNAAYNRLGFIMIMHDVTREAEVDKLKTTFISNVSHELRTPVTTIKSYVDTLYNHGKELDSETYDEFVETIHLETERLKKLVNDILDFSRLEQGGGVLRKEWQDLAPIVQLTVQSILVLAQEKRLTVTTSIESDLPHVYINSDSIERVVRNLLSNAIKYTPEGGRIKLRTELSQDGQWVEVMVQDTGIGIPEEHLDKIFDRFYRVENKVHTVKGTGLGLHLVKVAIEEHHGGQVFVRSQPGVGSVFGFRLPLAVPDPLLDEPEHEDSLLLESPSAGLKPPYSKE